MAWAQIRGKKRGKKHANKQNRKIKAISSHVTKQACLLHLVWPAQFWQPHYGRLNSPKSQFNWAAIAFSFFLSFLSLRILDIQCYSLIQKQKQNLWATLRTTVSSRTCTIVNWVEWLWNPSDSFVICFCGPESAQRSKEFLSFWLYWPIKTLH